MEPMQVSELNFIDEAYFSVHELVRKIRSLLNQSLSGLRFSAWASIQTGGYR